MVENFDYAASLALHPPLDTIASSQLEHPNFFCLILPVILLILIKGTGTVNWKREQVS